MEGTGAFGLLPFAPRLSISLFPFPFLPFSLSLSQFHERSFFFFFPGGMSSGHFSPGS